MTVPAQGGRRSRLEPRPTPARHEAPGGEGRAAAWEQQFLGTVAGADLLVAAVSAGVTSVTLRADLRTAAVIAVVAAAGWGTTLALLGGYRIRRMGSGPEEFQAVTRAALALFALIGLSAYTTQTLLPRRWVLITIPVVAGLTCVFRYLIRRHLHAQRRRGLSMLRTLVVGTRAESDPVVRDLAREWFHGYKVVGTCLPVLTPGGVEAGGAPVLGSASDVPQVVHDHRIDVVIVTGSALSGPALRRLSWALERAGADLVVTPGLVDVAGPHVSLRPTAGLSLVHLERPSRHLGRALAKAALDRVLGLLILTVAMLPIAVCALAVVLTSPGRPFFGQRRAGIDGRPFTMWKLRSMVVDAESQRGGLAAVSDRDGPVFKMREDPRVTPVGRVLRRFSLDELPQLWNVVRGDMSLVGPRPPLMSEVALYHDAVHQRLRVKPGLTGLWQVSGRADLGWEESVNLDLRYVDNWSLAMDLLILWRTLRVVVRGSGAY